MRGHASVEDGAGGVGATRGGWEEALFAHARRLRSFRWPACAWREGLLTGGGAAGHLVVGCSLFEGVRGHCPSRVMTTVEVARVDRGAVQVTQVSTGQGGVHAEEVRGSNQREKFKNEWKVRACVKFVRDLMTSK